jgi:hypothetical protein
MRDGTNWTGRFTGVAPNADFRIDQVLLDDFCFSLIHFNVSREPAIDAMSS